MVMVVTRPPNPVKNSIFLLHLVVYAVHNLEDFTQLGLGEAVGACGWGGPVFSHGLSIVMRYITDLLSVVKKNCC